MKSGRIIIAAGASGSGKTLITCGILKVLKNRRKSVASFKCGPDYIDPIFHSTIIGTKSRNLDTFFTSPQITRYLLKMNAADADISVIEGVMGYYDGIGGVLIKASAYELAMVTETPVVLIVNCRGMSVSILAYIQGFLKYKTDSGIKGVILNQISSALYPKIKQKIEEELKVTVYGYAPVVPDCVIESRHLGLKMPSEISGFKEKLIKLSNILEKTLNIDALLDLANQAPELNSNNPWRGEPSFNFRLPEEVTVAVARDEAFCFIYEDNIQLLEKMGAKIVYFSPLKDSKLPTGIHGLLLYGGYPELYGQSLEGNISMRESVLAGISNGLPVIAECGGFMYLHESHEDVHGNSYKMVGAIKGRAYDTKKLNRFGYIDVFQNNDNVLGVKLPKLTAHEFHYFDSTVCRKDFTARKPQNGRSWDCICADENQFIGFPHFYYYGNPQIPKAFLERCCHYQRLPRSHK